MSVAQDFVSQEPRSFKFKMGRYIASSLSGFVAGVIAASIIWLGVLWVANLYGKLIVTNNNPAISAPIKTPPSFAPTSGR